MNSEDHSDAAERIAIIGMAGRFPGAGNIAAFWRNLRAGVESIVFFTADELSAHGVPRELLADPHYVKANGVLADIELFDADFFGIPPREAELMDPQHRLFLECAWTALEHSGHTPVPAENRIAVFAGAGPSSYQLHHLSAHPELLSAVDPVLISMGNNKDYLPTRVSYKLNLQGPSVNVSTACSTALVAVHMACQSLLDYQCDMALAGGAGMQTPQQQGYLYNDGGILAPDGHCRAFDARAQGTVSGNGVGIVVLKRLEDALAAGDFIHAVIAGSAINNDGADKVGYTAPSVNGQAKVIAEAHALAGFSPETIGYIEAHGTGTALGDPIEIQALNQVFNAGTTRRGYCAIGSVKTNIGHLDEAAGVAGLIKTALILANRQIPPSLHFEQPNPRIDFADSPFFVNDRLRDWPAGNTPRRAGVSSFGIGGTNAHVVLEEAPPCRSDDSARPYQLLTLSARTPAALEQAGADLAVHFDANPEINLADAGYTLQIGRRAFAERRVLVCQTPAEAATALARSDARQVFSDSAETAEPVVAFLFPGQGSQYPRMGYGLYQTEPVFREQVDRCAEWLLPQLECDLRQVLYPIATDGAAERLRQTALTQPALFVVEYALAKLWQSWGIQPQAMLGHSLGEYVAACLAGVFTLENALTLVAARGRLMQQAPPGAMLAVPLTETEASEFLDENLALVAVNSPESCVLAGSHEAIAALRERLREQSIEGILLHTSHAFHSPQMAPLLATFEQQVQRIRLQPPQLPYISSLTGDWIKPIEATDPAYWRRHLQQTVRFHEGLTTLLRDAKCLLLEVGPGRTLITLATKHPQFAPPQQALASLRHPRTDEPDGKTILTSLGRLWAAGINVDWANFYAHERRCRLPLPTYPFERQRYWLEPARSVPATAPASTIDRIADWFYLPVWKQAEAIPESTVWPQRWLIFTDQQGLGQRLIDLLRRRNCDVVAVEIGSAFARLDQDTYAIQPSAAADYATLLAKLRQNRQQPEAVVHLWSVAPPFPGPDVETVASALNEGFYSLLFLAQALGAADDAELTLTVISNNMQAITGSELQCPEKATLLGPVQVIPKEYPQIHCRSIDLAMTTNEDLLDPALAEHLLADCAAKSNDTILAYRSGQRWSWAAEPVHWPAGGVPERLRQHGVYLITGGFGSMGLAFADYLARTVQAKLVLVGREIPSDVSTDARQQARRTKLDALRASGAEILVLQADVTDRGQMQVAIARTVAQFGALHGVIHTAGVLGQGMIHGKTRAQSLQTLAPKVTGTCVLTDAIKDLQPDFLLLCSSLSSVAPVIGQIDYSAANAFLDAFAHYQHRQGLFTIAIDWGFWQELGIIEQAAISADAKQAVVDEIQQENLADAGVAVLERVLAHCQMPQVMVSPQDFRKYLSPATALEPAFLSATPASVPLSHPLLEQCQVDGPQQVSYSARLSPRRHWLLDEHRFAGQALLPGTVYLELARAAYAHHCTARTLELREVYLLSPLALADDEEREVRVILKKQTDGHAFFIVSRLGEDRWQEHARGEIHPVDAVAKTHDLAALTAACDQSEQVFTEPATNFGPHWDSVRWVKRGPQQGLARLELPAAFAGEVDVYSLHPALLDMATGFMTFADALPQGLPFAYRRVLIQAPLPARLYSHALVMDSQPDTRTYDVTLLDEQGRELLLAEHYTLRAESAAAVESAEPADPEQRTASLAIASPGALDTLYFRAATRRPPGPGEVEIQVVVAGLNFIDVLYALGMLPNTPELGGGRFGRECAGVITAVGADVDDFNVGDEVIAFAPDCLGLYATTAAIGVARKPAHLSLEEAATIPAVFATAYCALVTQGRLRAGEKVLIHAAAGGVGLAAVNIAQWRGAEIYATAGSAVKRDYLRSLGVRHVFDSRSLDFADGVLAATDGQGVDVVLNSLSGDFIAKSLAILKPYGRFLEVGKRDLIGGAQLDLRPFLKSLSFGVIDVGPEMPGFSEVWTQVLARFHAQDFAPLPYRAFALNEALQAFEFMAQARHIGKIVLTVPDPAAVLAKVTAPKATGMPLAAIVGTSETAVPEPVIQPSTPTGYDRPALPSDYAAPSNPTEQNLAAIWQQLLGVAQIGVNDNFFELKGDSLLAAQVVSRVHKIFHVKLPLSSLFEEPTVAGLAKRIERLQKPELGTDEEEGEL